MGAFTLILIPSLLFFRILALAKLVSFICSILLIKFNLYNKYFIIISEVMINISKTSNRLFPLLNWNREINKRQKWMKSTKKQQIQQSSAQLLYGQQEKNKYIVFKDYLVPSRPKQLSRLQLYLMSDPDFNSKKLSLMQIKYEMKSLTPKQVKHYTEQMEIYNQTVIAKQQSECDKLYKIINKLPLYYNMLLVKTELPEAFKKKQQKGEQEGQKIEILEEAKRVYLSEEQINLSLSDREIYKKLQTIHPLIKYLTYEECQSIHHQQLLNKSYFNKHAFRIPYLYFYHPYQLYMIDQFKPDIGSLKKQDFFISFQQISSFDRKFEQLGADKRSHYEDKAQSMIEEYEAKIGQVVKKSGVSTKKLTYLIKNQFHQHNYNYNDVIR